jgi:hypothetical protein
MYYSELIPLSPFLTKEFYKDLQFQKKPVVGNQLRLINEK